MDPKTLEFHAVKRESTKPGLARQRGDFSLEGDSQLVREREREASVGWNTHLALVCRAVQNSGLDLNLSLVSEPPKMDLEVGISLDIFVLLSSVNTHKKKSLPPTSPLLLHYEFGYFNWLLEAWCH